MKITKIKRVGRKPVYDLSLDTPVYNKQHYVLKNGVVTHNTGIMYSSNQVFIISKAQQKEGTDLAGWKFTINIEKSRYVREKAKLPFVVTYENGIQKWDAIFDLAVDFGIITKPKMGWYQLADPETGEVDEKKHRLAAVMKNDEYFEKLIKDEEFNKFVESKFKLSMDLNKKDNVVEDDDDEYEVDNDE